MQQYWGLNAKNKALKGFMLALTGTLSTAAFAAPEPGSWHLNPTFGIQHHDSERELRNTRFWGAGVEYGVLEQLSVELGYWRGKADEKSLTWGDYFADHWPDLAPLQRVTGDARATFQEVRLDGLYHLQGLSWGGLTPYVVGGLGYARFDYDSRSSVSDVRLQAGPGVSVQLAERWRLLADARAAYSLDKGEVDWLGRLALSFKVAGRAANESFVSDSAVVEQAAAPSSRVELVEQAVTKQATLYFEVMETALSRENLSRLAAITAFMQEHPEATVLVSGHADRSGTTELNRQLAADRAQTTAQYLQEQGIAAERLELAYYGYDRPVASNDTAEGRALNRRAEVQARAVEVRVEKP